MAFTSISAMTAAGDPQASSDCSGKEAIEICLEAWNRGHDEQAEDENSTEYDCGQAGNRAYLKATPPLSGYQNICDFIACINYGSMTDIVRHRDAKIYLENARVALSALCHRPKPKRSRNRVGRPTGRRSKRKKLNN